MADFRGRALSWSAISSFKYDHEQWARKYIDDIKDPPNQAMLFGNMVGMSIAAQKTFRPDIPRYSIFEHKLTGKIGDIKLIGFADSFEMEPMAFLEYKTSANKNKWTQKSANEHGQLLMYMFLLWQMYDVRPEEIGCDLIYIPVEEATGFELKLSQEPYHRFPVKHTTAEVLHFASHVKYIYTQMNEYAEYRAKKSYGK